MGMDGLDTLMQVVEIVYPYNIATMSEALGRQNYSRMIDLSQRALITHLPRCALNRSSSEL